MQYATPSFYQRVFMDLKIKAMKLSGVWDKLDVYYNFGYSKPLLDEFSLIDWKNPGRIANRFGGIFFTSQGWQGNGVNGYINTGFNPSVHGANYTLNDASRLSVFYYDSGNANNVNVIDGIAENAIPNSSRLQNGFQYYINQQDTNNNPSAGVDFTGTGLKAINRISDNDLLVVNKDILVNSIQPSSYIFNANQNILRRGSGTASYGASGISVYGMGASLTYEQTQHLRTIENNWLRLNNLPEIA